MKTVHIQGMMCQHCAARAKKALAALDPNAEVILEKNIATVSDKVPSEEIVAAVKGAGYTVTEIE